MRKRSSKRPGTHANGARQQVSFGSYTGLAGVQTRGGRTQVAFLADIKRMTGVEEGTVEGVPFTVIDVVPSEHTRPNGKNLVLQGKVMLVLTVAPKSSEQE